MVWRRTYDVSSVGEDENFSSKHVWAAFMDWQVCSLISLTRNSIYKG